MPGEPLGRGPKSQIALRYSKARSPEKATGGADSAARRSLGRLPNARENDARIASRMGLRFCMMPWQLIRACHSSRKQTVGSPTFPRLYHGSLQDRQAKRLTPSAVRRQQSRSAATCCDDWRPPARDGLLLCLPSREGPGRTFSTDRWTNETDMLSRSGREHRTTVPRGFPAVLYPHPFGLHSFFQLFAWTNS
jgi:hypothetical protein